MTTNQLIKNPRKSKKTKQSTPALNKSPFKKGVCLRVFKLAPKKPNSAQRSVARVRLSGGKNISVYIPGEGHTIQEHSIILIRGGRVPDLPGIKYKAIRGKYDLGPVPNRKNSRSKYGVTKS